MLVAVYGVPLLGPPLCPAIGCSFIGDAQFMEVSLIVCVLAYLGDVLRALHAAILPVNLVEPVPTCTRYILRYIRVMLPNNNDLHDSPYRHFTL